jgi:molybdate transport system ATP-binding protein
MQITIRKRLVSRDRQFALDIGFESDSHRIAMFGPPALARPDAARHRRVAGAGQRAHRTQRTHAVRQRIRHRPAPQERRVAYLFQDYALFPHLTVAQNIAFGLNHGWRNPRRRELPPEAAHWVDAFGLREIVNQYPSEISGGQKQRVALARALAPKPDIVLLDEPFSALDPALRTRMREELLSLQANLEVPMVVISHDPQDVEILGDHVLEIREGRIFGSGTGKRHPPVYAPLPAHVA